jgi:hypothetical protein
MKVAQAQASMHHSTDPSEQIGERYGTRVYMYVLVSARSRLSILIYNESHYVTGNKHDSPTQRHP